MYYIASKQQQPRAKHQKKFEALLGEKAMAARFFKKNETLAEHRLKPYTLAGRRFIDLERGANVTDQVEVDLLEGNAMNISSKLRKALEKNLRKQNEKEARDEHEGKTGEDIAEVEALIEELINKIASWLENQFRDQALLIEDPSEIENINERGDLNLCVTAEFMNHIEANLTHDFYRFETINHYTRKLEFTLPSGREFRIVFIGKNKLENTQEN